MAGRDDIEAGAGHGISRIRALDVGVGGLRSLIRSQGLSTYTGIGLHPAKR